MADPLGIELECSRLVTMLYIDIQKGKEEIKKFYFEQDIGGTVACMKRMIRSTFFCDKLYVGADNFKGKFCATSNTIKNKDV